MKFKQITVSRGGTVNTGNFNNIRFDVSATVEIGEGEDVNEAFERASQWVHAKALKEKTAQ